MEEKIKFNLELESEGGRLYRRYCEEKRIDYSITAGANFCLGYMAIKPNQGAVWVKGAPKERKLYHARFKGHLSDLVHDGIIEPVTSPEYWQAIASGVRISIKDSHIIEYLDEGGTAVGREEETVSFADWANDNYLKCGDEMKWTPQFGNRRESFTTGQLYELFKQQKEKQ